MPWMDVTLMDTKLRFVRAYDQEVRSRRKTMSGLCGEYGIARKTGYKFIARRERDGLAGLIEQSRAPHSGRHWYDPEVVERVLELRAQFPHWGAETILSSLGRDEPDLILPSTSTAQGWLKQAGLVQAVRKQRRHPHPGKPLEQILDRPNQQWSIDVKGQFRTRDRRECFPLTMADSFSRYLLACQALTSTSFESVWHWLERLFRQYGLPESLLSDNGSPFASNSVARLSKLSVRCIRLGIVRKLTQPGRPQQNGRHERIHLHMDPLVCQHPEANARRHQRHFDWFVDHHNNVRPNQALGGKLPSELYAPSPRPYPPRLPQIEYAPHVQVRRVRSSGEILWRGQWFYISEALVGEWVGFEKVTDQMWVLRFGPVDLGLYSERDKKLYLDRTRPDGKAEND
jgi:transposase InsO family protein